jgi:peroxin-5
MWNKFGACMSNNMDLPQACSAYEQALELRPNYVRTMVNLGLAKNRMNDSQAAAQQFLNALILNPQVTHVWNYLRNSFMKMDRFDLIEKLEERDPNLFRDEFTLIDPKNMPQASMDGLAT